VGDSKIDGELKISSPPAAALQVAKAIKINFVEAMEAEGLL
jgi:hypothetical protein